MLLKGDTDKPLSLSNYNLIETRHFSVTNAKFNENELKKNIKVLNQFATGVKGGII